MLAKKNKKGIVTNERRDFLKKMGSVAVLGIMGTSFFTSCTEDETPTPTSTNNNNNGSSGSGDDGITIDGSTITIDTSIVTELNNEGGWVLVSSAQTLVVNDGSIKALTSICTHSGCDRNWNLTNGNFVCTCHGSVFSTDGTVISGPANRDLEQFSVNVSGDVITITK